MHARRSPIHPRPLLLALFAVLATALAACGDVDTGTDIDLSSVQEGTRLTFTIEGGALIESVDFLVDDRPHGSDDEAPFQTEVDTAGMAAGSHTVSALVHVSVWDESDTLRRDETFVVDDLATGDDAKATRSGFTLIDAEADVPVAGYDPLPDGATLNLATLPSRALNIRTDAGDAGSVVFELNGVRIQTESEAPFALTGDINGDYNAWKPSPGTYEVVATPYARPGAEGAAGTPMRVRFSVIDDASSGDAEPVEEVPLPQEPAPEQPAPQEPSPEEPTQASGRIAFEGERWFLDGRVTNPGSRAEGLLVNARLVQAVFDDANPATVGNWRYPNGSPFDPDRQTNELVDALPTYASYGLNAITVNFQGGYPQGGSWSREQPWINTAFREDGSVKPAYLDRMDRVIRAADRNDIVVILGLFYFGQDERLRDEAAVIRAVDEVTDWLVRQGYGNVLVEITNESDIGYDHGILRPGRVHELIRRVQQRSGGELLVSTSLGGGSIPPAEVLRSSDFVLLHGNHQDAAGIRRMVAEVRSRLDSAKPIVFNEDPTLSNLDVATDLGVSWGWYRQGKNDYVSGFQSPPTNWKVNTDRKQAFFERVRHLTR